MEKKRVQLAHHCTAPPLGCARFVLDGKTCVILENEIGGTAREHIGSLELDGCCYIILLVPEEPPRPDLAQLLSPRELEIALHVASGNDCKMVARRLRISFHTVRVHLGRIYAKLGLHKQTELAAMIATEFGPRNARAPDGSEDPRCHRDNPAVQRSNAR